MPFRATSRPFLVRDFPPCDPRTERQARIQRPLVVNANAGRVPDSRALQVDVEGRERSRVREGLWLAFVFVVREVMKAIPLDRSAKGCAHRLIRVRKHVPSNRIRGIEFVTAEIAGKSS